MSHTRTCPYASPDTTSCSLLSDHATLQMGCLWPTSVCVKAPEAGSHRRRFGSRQAAATSACADPLHRDMATHVAFAGRAKVHTTSSSFVSHTFTSWSYEAVTNRPVSTGYQVTPDTVNWCVPRWPRVRRHSGCSSGCAQRVPSAWVSYTATEPSAPPVRRYLCSVVSNSSQVTPPTCTSLRLRLRASSRPAHLRLRMRCIHACRRSPCSRSNKPCARP
mmetsp:Transcript_2140/g.5437  ORF Transcript_2140/g.5437 Transcript_2140/m.5437 type:complete len:219 (-) Transcript_2140:54-710(-)